MSASDPMPGDEHQPSAHQLSVQRRFRWINDHIRELYPGVGHDGSVDFVCECANDRCFLIVPLAVAEYDRLCTDRSWVTAQEHAALAAA